MKRHILAAALIATLSQATFADSGDAYWNNVSGGFDNMLNHQPYYGPTAVTVARGEPDLVETLLHAMVRETNRSAPARGIDFYHDPVAAAFGRMLDHAPHAGETAVTVARQKDYRVDRLVLSLLHPQRGAAATLAAAGTPEGVR